MLNKVKVLKWCKHRGWWVMELSFEWVNRICGIIGSKVKEISVVRGQR